MAISPVIIIAVLLVVVGGMSFAGKALKKKRATAALDAPIVEDTEGQNKTIMWIKRLGFAGFMFFLIKGLVWLVIFYYASKTI